ncbi:hypothetical protein SAMN05192588_2257 [Nonlabens sp. Hel1_33_55]|uniref:hypothetical protein n=1 Tax=Nonlabens sp. Hel1_33_55 TaxID=1336802 RepID=UPI000875BF51|nr:hypothetical protein [Nonlabens sp. Hel1_33_55]SCY32382.1 hypothetical protein SAMN05192588_2257 [Nonlabens sp. Hel1_33_55]
MKNLRLFPILMLLVLSGCKKDSSTNIDETISTETSENVGNNDASNRNVDSDGAQKKNIDPNSRANNSATNSAKSVSYQSAVLTPTSINFVKSDGTQDIIMFGRNEAMILEKMKGLVGSPSSTKINEDCNSRQVKSIYWEEHITLEFNQRDDDWILGGWNLQSRDDNAPNYKLASGLTVNLKRNELSKPLSVKPKKTNLGYSLNLDGVTAVLDSDADDATVTYVYSGVNCNQLKAGETPQGETN